LESGTEFATKKLTYQWICSLIEIVEPVLPVSFQVTSAILRMMIKLFINNQKSMVMVKLENTYRNNNIMVRPFKMLREMETM